MIYVPYSTEAVYAPKAAVPLPNLGPTKAHPDDAAYDLRAAHDFAIDRGNSLLINTGVRIAIPEGYAGLVLPRSGLALNNGLTVLNAPGLIDPGYRGDIGVILANLTGSKNWHIGKTGDRIAQLLIIKTADVRFQHTTQLRDTDRGDSGFGSTGR